MSKSSREITAVITVRRKDCEITNYILQTFPDASIERLKIDGKTTTHRISFRSDEDADSALPEIKKITIDTVKTGKRIVWAKGSCCSACSVIGNSEAVILGSRVINPESLSYRVSLPGISKLMDLKRNLQREGMEFSISDISFDEGNAITDREKEIIFLLYEYGYFDPERKLSLTQIAEQMGISTAALSEILRKTLRKIVKDYVESKL
ncbi:MAG: helix-turn-helix domain-containing protein [Ferroplasma sp.]|uniref:helix-turn-helix domain-containing protein n=1 Tax=Ferroplasma sp. TaxID=2591003 RepID=UPI002815F8D7|nr:helix-turn-helix domain-containing protein [Ferroplasma sp.]WMT51779.1 MAG: helix-turn-helix domain-containing protein [Ferroplasma sp.]